MLDEELEGVGASVLVEQLRTNLAADGCRWCDYSAIDGFPQVAERLRAGDIPGVPGQPWAYSTGAFVAALDMVCCAPCGVHVYDRVSEEQWRSEIGAAMLSQQIECMPGSYRGRITHRRMVRLVGSTPPRRAVAARPGSLKREPIEAELRVERAVKRKLRVIDLGREIPFTRIPRIVEEGFAALAKVFLRGNAGIREHYHVARNCLQECLGDPLCDVLLIIVVTLSSCSVTPWVAPNAKGFERKDPAQFAANLATRMLWFLRPNAFPWDKDEGVVLRITEMTKNTEHKGVNNQLMWAYG
ncbi:hypothetical protein V500_04256 [Pseudogymnoascus sp. VKM F-4518 (FW-2643)]|nr:hypothetical protein V500_04256 [Pseudogymnoascus sp. VKM F-4518 (FW-2643)]